MKGNNLRMSFIFVSACGIFSGIVMPKITVFEVFMREAGREGKQ